LDFEPILIESVEPEEVEQIHLFTIDGVDYHMPAVIPPSVALEMMDIVRREGDLAASAWMLEEVLGTDAYEALIHCRSITKAQMRQINDIVADHVVGQLGDEDPAGNGQGPNRAARRSVRRAASSNGRSGSGGSSSTRRTSTPTSGASTGSPRSKQRTS
jgi:hypothetical protein